MKYFSETEFVMGDEVVFDMMDADLLERLDALREAVNEPLYITSSYRDEDYNNAVAGSSTTSMHLKGRAVDLACNNGTLRAKIVKNALNLGLTVGVAKTFVHVDNRDNQIVFTY